MICKWYRKVEMGGIARVNKRILVDSEGVVVGNEKALVEVVLRSWADAEQVTYRKKS